METYSPWIKAKRVTDYGSLVDLRLNHRGRQVEGDSTTGPGQEVRITSIKYEDKDMHVLLYYL